MKKVMLILLVLLMCGCSNKDKYKDFEHYDLREFKYEEYVFPRENKGIWKETEIENYAIAIIESGVMRNTEGLLYKVAENDYILLDDFEGHGVYGIAGHVFQYEDKIYIVGNELMINEYTLNGENTTVRELATKFDYSSITSKYEEGGHKVYPYGHLIEKVDDDFIYFKGIFIPNAKEPSKNIKCSLNDYKCEEI